LDNFVEESRPSIPLLDEVIKITGVVKKLHVCCEQYDE